MPCGLVSLVYVAGASDKKEKNVHGYAGADLCSKSHRLSDAKICESRNTDMGANCETGRGGVTFSPRWIPQVCAPRDTASL